MSIIHYLTCKTLLQLLDAPQEGLGDALIQDQGAMSHTL